MNIKEEVAKAVKQCQIPQATVEALLIECWDAKVKEAMSDLKLETEEIKILRDLAVAIGLSSEKMQKSPHGKLLYDCGQKLIRGALVQYLKDNDFEEAQEEIEDVASKFGFTDAIVHENVLQFYSDFLEKAFEDGLLSEAEEAMLYRIAKKFDLTEKETEKYKLRITKGRILRKVLSGITPNVSIDEALPILLQPKEKLIWCFADVKVYEDKVSRQFVVGSSGETIQVMNGVYARVGQFQGQPVEIIETSFFGQGKLYITNMALYWVSGGKSIKLPAKKIISVIPYSDGLVIQKDGVRAKPQTFMLGDVWFAYNLIINLNLLKP